MKKKTFYLLSIIDPDTYREIPQAIFNSKKELQKGIKRYEKNLKLESGDDYQLIENEDYTIHDFYLNNFY